MTTISHIYTTAICFVFVTSHILSGGKSRGPMRWRGSSGEYLCWACAGVRQKSESASKQREQAAYFSSKQQAPDTQQQTTADSSQGAPNSDPLVRLACCFVQCASRERTASALLRLGCRLPTHGGKKAPARSASKQQASSHQRAQTAAKAL
jgi:hypothetical protein